jgi:hypothetical protein
MCVYVCMYEFITSNEILKWKYVYVYVNTDWGRRGPPGIWEADEVCFLVLFSFTMFLSDAVSWRRIRWLEKCVPFWREKIGSGLVSIRCERLSETQEYLEYTERD